MASGQRGTKRSLEELEPLPNGSNSLDDAERDRNRHKKSRIGSSGNSSKFGLSFLSGVFSWLSGLRLWASPVTVDHVHADTTNGGYLCSTHTTTAIDDNETGRWSETDNTETCGDELGSATPSDTNIKQLPPLFFRQKVWSRIEWCVHVPLSQLGDADGEGCPPTHTPFPLH